MKDGLSAVVIGVIAVVGGMMLFGKFSPAKPKNPTIADPSASSFAGLIQQLGAMETAIQVPKLDSLAGLTGDWWNKIVLPPDNPNGTAGIGPFANGADYAGALTGSKYVYTTSDGLAVYVKQ